MEGMTWLRLSTGQVMTHFLDALARSHRWNRIFLISPWISDFDIPGVMSLRALLRRTQDDECTLYVVTRPPEEHWHQQAIDTLTESGVANIRVLASLHSKLYYADTAQGAFALFGSANLTQRSLSNREIGMLIRATAGGVRFVRELSYEASSIYRSADSRVICTRTFKWGQR